MDLVPFLYAAFISRGIYKDVCALPATEKDARRIKNNEERNMIIILCREDRIYAKATGMIFDGRQNTDINSKRGL
jgi:hypothetical protein